MQIAILAVFLGAVFAWFAPPVQTGVQRWLRGRATRLWMVPLILTAAFAAASAAVGAFGISLTLAVLAYTALPTLCVMLAGRGKDPGWLDFAAILLLWLPIEFAAGAGLVPRPVRGFLHSVGYGTAILLGLALFLGYRAFAGMKYRLPQSGRDFRLALAGFVTVAPVLVLVGILIGFIPYPHGPSRPAGSMAGAVGIIFAGTALPEEILFRSLIQNLMMLRFGAGWRTLVAASIIFGAAHLDNGPQAVPNWRYAIEATIAGIVYGRVFQKASSVTSSAILHMLVDWTKHFFF